MSRKKVDARAAEWLSRLQSSELSDQQKEEFFSWLETDVSHQQAYIGAEKSWELSEMLKSRQSDIAGRKSFLDTLNIELSPHIIASACSVAFIVVLGLFWLPSFRQDPLEYETTVGEQQRVHLSDGSELVLNTDSHVRVEFDSSTRTVFLERGEALFDVRNDEKRPFDVITRSGIVRVKGTIFTVFDSGEQTLVTVLEGQVALARKHGATVGNAENFQADITLNANEQVALELAQEVLSPKKVSASALVSWKDKKLIYREEPLVSVLQDVNRYYNTEIVIGDQRIADRKLFGIIAINDFDKTLRALEEALELKSVVEKNNNRAVLYTK